MAIEWPAIYVSADDVSLKGQTRQKLYLGSTLGLNVISAALAMYAGHKTIALTMLVAMIIAFALSLILLMEKPQTEWYNGRALAESVKTLSWRFVTCAVPYTLDVPEQEAKRQFVAALEVALKEGNSISSGLFTGSGHSTQITRSMLEARRLPLAERRDLYLRERLQDQQQWYSKAAKRNRRAERAWGWVLVGCQAAALFLAAFAAVSSTSASAIAMIGIITTAASGVAAWQQQCQFGALASAYAMTAQELSFVQTLIDECETEQALSEFVLSAERAISREHTFWLARRRNP